MELLRTWRGMASLAAFLVLTSCWSPVFNADISLAALTTSKMDQDAKFSADLHVSSNSTILAIPSREKSPSTVVVFVVSPTNYNYLVYRNSGSDWSVSVTSNQVTFDAPIPDPELLSPQIGLAPSVSLAFFTPTQGNGTVVLTDDSYSGFAPSYYPLSPATSPTIYGLSSYPPSAGVDLHLFTATAGALGDETTVLGTPTPSPTPGVSFVGASLDSNSYGWYAYDPANQVAYLTHHGLSGGRYTTERIDGVSTAIWNRKDRVVAFLTTGELLTREGGYYDVCDGNGTIKYSFPAGSLRFAHEYLDGNGVAWCAFTEVYSANGSSGGSSSRIAVFSLPTSRLSSLK